MTGVYVQRAIASCFDKSVKYPESPLDVRSQAEIDEFLASPEYKEQQRIMIKVSQNQGERRKRLRDERRAKHYG